MKQGTPEWFEARRGMITASRAADILSTGQRKTADCKCGNQRAKPPNCSRCGEPVTLTPGKAYLRYRREVWMERRFGITVPEFDSRETEHGNEWEPIARQMYDLTANEETTMPGFVVLGTSNLGCSPDCYVGDRGLAEIKCPINPLIHVGYMDGLWTDHMPQMWFQLGVTGREWCDFVSFSHYTEFGDRQLFVTRIKAANWQEEIAHLMSLARRMDREITDMMTEETDRRSNGCGSSKDRSN